MIVLPKRIKQTVAAFVCIMTTAFSLSAQAITQEEIVYNQVSQYNTTAEAAHIAQDILDASYAYDVDPILATAVFTTESHFDQGALSGVGAVGIAQLMPDTAAGLGVNPYDRKDNIYGGVKYLSQMLNRYKDTENPFLYAVAAYNAGPGAVDAAGGVPNYRETQNYVRTVEQTRQNLWRLGGYKGTMPNGTAERFINKMDQPDAPVFPSLQEWRDQKAAHIQQSSLTQKSTNHHVSVTNSSQPEQQGKTTSQDKV